jgi:enamine deaminase RidA (YjgF/YER057c/UK114 family)
MPINRYSSGTRFEDLAAYSRAVADAHYIHVSGTVGSDPRTGEMPDDVREQLENIFSTIAATLDHFGAGLDDVVRTRVYLASADVLMPVAAALREQFEHQRPANTTLICGIPAPGAMVEIEVTARRPA